MTEPTEPAGDETPRTAPDEAPAARPPTPASASLVAPTPDSTSAVLGLAVALAVFAAATGVLADALGAGPTVVALATGLVVGGIGLAGGLLDRRLRRDRREALAVALVDHVRGAPAPDRVDAVVAAALDLVAEARRSLAERDAALAGADARARAEVDALAQARVAQVLAVVGARRADLLAAVRDRLVGTLEALLADEDPEVAAVADAVALLVEDAVDLADRVPLRADPAPATVLTRPGVHDDAAPWGRISVADLLVVALEPLGRLDPGLVVDVSGDPDDVERAVPAEVGVLTRAVRTLVGAAAPIPVEEDEPGVDGAEPTGEGSAAVGDGRVLQVTVAVVGDEVDVRLGPLPPPRTAHGTDPLELAARAVVLAHDGAWVRVGPSASLRLPLVAAGGSGPTVGGRAAPAEGEEPPGEDDVDGDDAETR